MTFKHILWTAAALIMALFLFTTFGSCLRNKTMVGCSHMRSSVYGLNRTVTWTGFNGTTKTWRGNYRIEYEGAAVRMIDLKTSKTIVLGSGYCIEEE
jgi:hypothetical protein